MYAWIANSKRLGTRAGAYRHDAVSSGADTLEYLVVNGCMPSRSGIAVPSSNVPATASVESRVTQGSHIVRDACLKYGIPVPDLLGDYDDLYEEAMAERYPEWVEL